MNNKKNIELSKLISYWLRHNPQEANLEMDDFGWVSTSKLLSKLQQRNYIIHIEDLPILNNSFDKIRWEFNDNYTKIRATHGHSVSTLIDDYKKEIPAYDFLYHATSLENVYSIIQQGLRPMNRQFVHLTQDEALAIDICKRRDNYFIIEIDVEDLVKDDFTFYKTADNVWLTKTIAPKYLRFRPWHKVEEKELEEICYALEELKKELYQDHPLYNVVNNLKLTWRNQTCDDCLFSDIQTKKYYVIHLTWKGKQEIKGFPGFDAYESFEHWILNGLGEDNQYFYGY